MNPPSSMCVENPEIKEVMNFETGDILPVQVVIGSDYDRLEKLRMELAEANASEEPIYVCPICMVGVYLSHVVKDRHFFFKRRTENGNFPAITIAGRHKQVIRAFRVALSVYDRGDLLKSQDHEKKWAKKVEEYREKLKANDPEYQREERFDGLIAFLFPEVWEALK